MATGRRARSRRAEHGAQQERLDLARARVHAVQVILVAMADDRLDADVASLGALARLAGRAAQDLAALERNAALRAVA